MAVLCNEHARTSKSERAQALQQRQLRAYVMKLQSTVIWTSIAFAIAVLFAHCGGSGTTGGSTPTYTAPTAPPAPGQVPAGATIVNIPVSAVGKGSAAYGVNPLVVTMGTTVTWVNQDSMPHTATSDSGVWDSGTLTQGQTFSFVFSTPGTFPYHCSIHGVASMSGTIQVNQ